MIGISFYCWLLLIGARLFRRAHYYMLDGLGLYLAHCQGDYNPLDTASCTLNSRVEILIFGGISIFVRRGSAALGASNGYITSFSSFVLRSSVYVVRTYPYFGFVRMESYRLQGRG